MRLLSLVIIVIGLVLGSCTSNSSSSSSVADGEEVLVLKLNAEGFPLPDLGITVVNPEGWSEDQMNFQQNYCLTMFEKLEGEYDSEKFCLCFLDKVQYYYKPVYIFEAFDDQKTWNSYCLKDSTL